MTKESDVTIILPNYNSELYIKNLDSISHLPKLEANHNRRQL